MAKNIVLIGYRGTGKSSVARCLSEQLGWDWKDVDPIVESEAGMSIKEIFASQGESVFRDWEQTITARLLSDGPLILASGGGVILREANRECLANHLVVWLTASAETLYRRIYDDPTTGDRRPNLTASGGLAEINEVLGAREPLYRNASRWQVDTEGKTPDQIAAEIVSLLGDSVAAS